ncbi:MAG: hypothetical protein HQ567_32795 [Candidatus Nealsonbacteria bacterium]|nr:hypothetical protein [Candidatus Nealsonbacteria bacterium]
MCAGTLVGPRHVHLLVMLQHDGEHLVVDQQVVEFQIAGVLAVVGKRLRAQISAPVEVIDVQIAAGPLAQNQTVTRQASRLHHGSG